MKNRLTFVITVLIVASLACTLPAFLGDEDEVNPSSTRVLSLAVNPPAGSGSFTLEVTYEAFYSIMGKLPPMLVCIYVTPDSATMPIGNIFPKRPAGFIFSTWANGSEKLPFNVTQANGISQPGTYVASCSTGEGSLVTTTFVVTGGATETPAFTPTATSSPSPTAGPFTVSGAGRQIIIYSQPTTATCTVPADLSLTVNVDGTAEIRITTATIDSISNLNNQYNDIYDCFWRPGSNTFALPGQVDLATQTVKFNQSDNTFLCDGAFSYAGETLSGELLCGSYRDVKIVMP